MRLQVTKRVSHYVASCHKCEGTGFIWETDWDYHKGTDNGREIDCPTCDGQGRLIKVEEEYRAALGYQTPVSLKQEIRYLPFSRELPKNTWETVGAFAID